MASEFLRKKAQERAAEMDRKYGADAYGGSNWREEKSGGSNATGDKNASKNDNETKDSNTSASSTKKSSSFLQKKAAEKASEVDKKYGVDAYGGSNWRNGTYVVPVKRNYYSATEMSKNRDALYSDITNIESTYLEKRKAVESSTSELERLAAQAKADPENVQLRNSYNAAYDNYTKLWNEFKPIQDAYTKAVDAYNAEYTNWRGTIRGKEDVEKAFADLDARIKELEDIENEFVSFEIATRDIPADQRPVKTFGGFNTIEEVQAEIKRLNTEQRALLNEEKYWGEYFGYTDLLDSADFEKYAAKGASDTKNYVGYLRGITDEWADIYSYMTDGTDGTVDEVAIYNYLLGKEGEERANEYLDFLMESLNARKGEKIGSDIRGIENGLWRGIRTGLYSLETGVDQFSGGVEQLISREDLPTSATQYASQYIQDDIKDNKVGSWFYNAGTTIGNMAPSILLSYATAGLAGAAGATASAAGTAGKIAGAASMAASASGNAYGQALNMGYNETQARTYSTLVGASEGALQYLLGGIGAMGGVTDDILLAKVAAIENGLARFALTGSVKLGSEIAEEEIQNVLEPLFAHLIFDVEYDAPTFQEIVDTAIVTALSTGVLEGGSIYKAGFGKLNGMDIDTAKAIIEEGLLTDPNSSSYKLAEALQNILDNGGTINDFQINALHGQNVDNVDSTTDPDAILAEAAAEAVARENGTEMAQDDVSAENVHGVTESAKNAPTTAREAMSAAAMASVPYNVLNQQTSEYREAHPGYGEVGTKTFRDIVESGSETVEDVRRQFQTAYELGKLEAPREKIHLSGAVQESAYNAGRQDAILSMKKAVSKGATVWGKEGGLIHNEYSAKLDTRTTDTLHKIGKATGTKIVFDAQVGGGDANGAYVDSEGTIHIAADAVNPVMVVVKHELTHRLQALAPKEYTQFRNYAVQVVSEGNWNMYGSNTAVEDMQEAYYQASKGRVNLTTEQAMDEIAADFTERILTDEQALNDFVNHVTKSEEHRTMGEKFFQAVREFIDKVKRIFKGDKAKMDDAAREEYGVTIEQLEKAEQLWKDAYKAAESRAKAESGEATTKRDGKLFRTTEADGTEVLTTANDNPVAMMDENGGAVFSLKTYDAFGRGELKRWLDLRVSKNQLDKADAADIVRQLDEYYDLCQNFLNKYAPFGAWSNAEVVRDNQGKPVFSVVKANGEYAMNLDFSLVCKKRRTLDAVFGEMIRRGMMDNVDLAEADIAKINDVIRESGFETACALCFVDAKRYRQAKVADAFVNQYNELVMKLLPEGGDVKAHYFDFVETGHYKNKGTGLHTLSNAELKSGIENLKQVMRENGSKTVPYKIAKHLLENPQDRKLVNRGEFMNTDGFGAVRLKNPRVLSLYNSSKGSGGPKAAFSDVQYLGDILKKNNFTPGRAYAVGGVRIQSFSDYIPRLVFDYLQMVADLSAKKLPAHAYTKEAIFVQQFGMTGIKMNMSLVPAVSEDGVAAGLDKDGNYLWFDGQSFGSEVGVKGSGQSGFELAIEIQNAEGYSEHCGTIAVGVSDEHIWKMLDDENIRMIIPYHKSSLNHIVAVMNNIDKYTDYTKVQNTRVKATGGKITGKDFNFNEALRRTGDAKTAANEYLAWCEKNGYIPKFDTFAGHENYYKVLEDFATYDNGVAAPQGPVTMTFPKTGDVFGSMAELIEQGLDEDAVLEGRRDKSLSSIVDKVEGVLNKRGMERDGLTAGNNVQDNVRYSLKDSEGTTLTKAQQDFFHDSKARDKDGNLQVFYHGTQSGGFTVFDPEQSDDRTSLFFTTSLSNAASYSGTHDIHVPGSKDKATNYAVYLNLTEPLILHAENANYDEIKFYTSEMKAMNDRSAELTNYGYSLDENDPKRAEAFAESDDLLDALDEMDMWNGDRKDTRFIAKWAKDHGYNGVIIHDLVDYAGEADVHIESATVAIAFSEDQVKSVENKDPTPDPDIRYSMKDSTGKELTEAQAEFFKDSKVLDENGNLLVVHHGTASDFTTFDSKKLAGATKSLTASIGFFFTDSKKVADHKFAIDYSDPVRAAWGVGDRTNGRVMDVYLNITNPKVYAETDDRDSFQHMKRDLRDYAIKATAEWAYPIDSMRRLDTMPPDVKRQMAEGFRDELLEQGYDGIVIERTEMDGVKGARRHTMYVAFEANQIKSVDNETPTPDPDTRYSMKEQAKMMRDNARLKEVNAALKAQFQTTKFAKVDPKELRNLARKLVKDYESEADVDEVQSNLDTLYTFLANDDPTAVSPASAEESLEVLANSSDEFSQPSKWNAAYRMAYDTAKEIIEAASVTDDTMWQEYEGLRKYLRTTGISMNREYENDLMGYENLDDFRKRNFGRIKIVKNGLDINTAYNELANMYPGLFSDEAVSHPGDQLTHLADVLDSLEPRTVNPFGHDVREAATWLANDIMERFFELPQAKPTFADKAERRLTEQVIKDTKKLEAVREQNKEKVNKILTEYREKVKETRQKEKAAKWEAVEKVKDHYKAKEAKMSESRRASVLRERITRHASELKQKLLRGTDKKHIPQELQGAVSKLLECINLESKYEYAMGEDGLRHRVERGTVQGAEPAKRTQAFAELQSIYAQLANELTIDPDLLGDDGLLNDVIKLADKPLATMTSSELQIVWDTMRAVEASVRTANKTHNAARWHTVEEAATALLEDNADKRDKTELRGNFGKAQKLVELDMETPETYFHMLGNAGDGIFRMMRNAQDQHIRLMKEAADFTGKAFEKVNVRKLENEMHEVTLGGEKIKLSTAQIMELYVLMKRQQAMDHIFVGGILPDVVSAKGLKKITKSKPVRGITLGEVSDAVNKLTEEQRKLAEKLQNYASTTLSKWGNKASMEVYGYEKFGEKNYWPIRVNRQEVKSDVQKDTATTAMPNKGFTRGTKPHANNSLRLGSIFDTFATHSSEMATYAAWLGTMEDVNRIRNYTFKDEASGHAVDTVKAIISTVHGTNGNTYLDKLLKDITNGVKGTHSETDYMSALMGNFKAASVGANLRVIIQQPTAMLRAMDMIGAQYFVGVPHTGGWAKAKKYAPIAQWKDWGYFDINTGRQMKDVLFDSDTLVDKTKNFSMLGASAMDSAAWGALWNAVERETKAKHEELKPGTEAFYKAVAERFTEIVDHTQVVDGILQRSHIMRNPDTGYKMATAFMGEPTKQYNMMMQVAYDMKKTSGKDRKAAVKHLARTAVTLAVAGVANAMMQSIIDAVRDDDEEKNYWGKWLENFKDNTIDAFNPMSYIPFAKDFISLIQGYDVARMDMETVSKVVNAGRNMIKALKGEGKYTIQSAAITLIAEVARLYGIPVSNLKREISTFAKSGAIWTDNYLMQYRMEKWDLSMNNSLNRSTFTNILYNAYKNDKDAFDIIYADMLKEDKFGSVNAEGEVTTTADYIASALKSRVMDDLFALYKSDQAAYKEMYSDLISRDFLKKGDKSTADIINSAMESLMKKDQGVSDVDDLDQRYYSPADQRRYDEVMSTVQKSGLWSAANEKQRDNLRSDVHDYLTGESKAAQEMVEDMNDAKNYGIDETEYLLWNLALEMYDMPSDSGSYGSYNTREKADAIAAMTSLSDKEKAYLWSTKTTSDEVWDAYDAGVDISDYVDFKAALSELEAGVDYKKGDTKSRKNAIADILNSMGLTEDDWHWLYHTEYKK